MKDSGFKIKLRKATLQDLPYLQHWDKQPHVIAAAPNDEIDWKVELARNAEWQELLMAECNARPVGFIQIIDPEKEESHYWRDVPPHLRAIDIWIGEKEDLGKGYGTRMMDLALEHCFKDKNVTTVLIDPLETNVRARKFYERLGFKFVENRKFDEDNCAVYRLDREVWEGR